MAAVSLPSPLSASKLRRQRAVKTRERLHEMAYKSDSLQQVQCQLAMLTTAVDNLAAMFFYSKANMDTCQADITRLIPHMPHQSSFPEHGQISEVCEVNVSSSTSDGADGGNVQPTSVEAHRADSQHMKPSIVQPGHSLTSLAPPAQSSAITSSSMADIIQKIEQGLVRAVEFYDSCKTLVAASVDGHRQTIVQVPRESLSEVLAKLRGEKVQVKSYFDKKFIPPVQPAVARSSTDDDNDNGVSRDSSEDALEFSRCQVLVIVDSTVEGFVQNVAGDGFSASDFSEVANAVKESLPISADLGDDEPALSRAHVRKMMEIIAKGCQRILKHPKS